MSDRLTPDFWIQVKPIILQMRNDRRPWDEICDHIGVSRTAMRAWRLAQPEPQLHARPKQGSSWPTKRLRKATHLWTHTSLGCTEIGRKLRVSKNAVIGQMRRAGLSPREAHRAAI